MTQEQEYQLLQDLQNKRISAFKTLVVEYWDDLRIVATHATGDPVVADDLASKFLIDQYNEGFRCIALPIRRSLFKKLQEAYEDKLLEKFI